MIRSTKFQVQMEKAAAAAAVVFTGYGMTGSEAVR